MAKWPHTEEFTRHSANLRAVDKDLKQLQRVHRSLIRNGGEAAARNNSPEIWAVSRLHYLSLGVWAEASLRKILTDPTGFNDRERNIVWRNQSQELQWLSTIEYAARRHFAVPMHMDVDGSTTDPGFIVRYDAVRLIFTEQINPVIRDRNTLAHGQWVWKLKSRKPNTFLDDRVDLDRQNYKVLFAKAQILKHFGLLIQALAVSSPTFGRDFDGYSAKILAGMDGTSDQDYYEYAIRLQSNRVVP